MSRLICVSSVPSHHRVTAYGAAGGRSVLAMSRSHGVCITGDFLLRRGELLYILVGQQGEDACPNVSIILLIQFLHLFLNGCKIQFKSWTYIFHFYKLSYILLSQKNLVYIYIYTGIYFVLLWIKGRKRVVWRKLCYPSQLAGGACTCLCLIDSSLQRCQSAGEKRRALRPTCHVQTVAVVEEPFLLWQVFHWARWPVSF